MKRLIVEIIVIVSFAVFIGLFFNSISPDGIGLKNKEEVEFKVDDNELFESKPQKLKTNEDLIQDTTTISKENVTTDYKAKDEESNKIQGDVNNEKNVEDHSEEIKSVNYNQIKKIVGDDNFVIIDARSPELFSENRIGDAINIFPYADNEDEIVEKIYQLPFEKKIVVYCDGGNCDASHKLSEMIKLLGFENVYIYTGGWEEWAKMEGLS